MYVGCRGTARSRTIPPFVDKIDILTHGSVDWNRDIPVLPFILARYNLKSNNNFHAGYKRSDRQSEKYADGRFFAHKTPSWRPLDGVRRPEY